jgi:bifunctional DNA-binding transcriptional regulator/antitoxin component of YhaV-PrlF toxin-antitoxin module
MTESKFIGKVKITKQGQLTLPLEARKDLGINLEDEVYWYELDGVLIVTRELLNQKDLDRKVRGKK